MPYQSILFPWGRPENKIEKDLLKDLRIDDILETLSHGPDQATYTTYYTPLCDLETIRYRHSIFKDLKNLSLYESMKNFQELMESYHNRKEELAAMDDEYIRIYRTIFDARRYSNVVKDLYENLQKADLHSDGLIYIHSFIEEYFTSEYFTSFARELSQVEEAICQITYVLRLDANRITISKYQGEVNYEQEMRDFFSSFLEENLPNQERTSRNWEASIIDKKTIRILRKLYPDAFTAMCSFVEHYKDFIPKEIVSFHEDLGFYMSWLSFIAPLQTENKLPFCLPEFKDWSDCRKEISFSDCYDLILAEKIHREKKGKIITNSLALYDKERIMILTGPNQGGKTTYARMLGQLFYFASLGLPVPGTYAQLFLPDQIFTHFERKEEQMSFQGKLKDDIVRIHDILEKASEHSLILINEMFASTTLQDAHWLGNQILMRIRELGCHCLYVTFINDLRTTRQDTVGLISQMEEDGEKRSYRIVRGENDGKAYAISIAKKYHLSREEILQRLHSGLEET